MIVIVVRRHNLPAFQSSTPPNVHYPTRAFKPLLTDLWYPSQTKNWRSSSFHKQRTVDDILGQSTVTQTFTPIFDLSTQAAVLHNVFTVLMNHLKLYQVFITALVLTSHLEEHCMIGLYRGLPTTTRYQQLTYSIEQLMYLPTTQPSVLL